MANNQVEKVFKFRVDVENPEQQFKKLAKAVKKQTEIMSDGIHIRWNPEDISGLTKFIKNLEDQIDIKINIDENIDSINKRIADLKKNLSNIADPRDLLDKMKPHEVNGLVKSLVEGFKIPQKEVDKLNKKAEEFFKTLDKNKKRTQGSGRYTEDLKAFQEQYVLQQKYVALREKALKEIDTQVSSDPKWRTNATAIGAVVEALKQVYAINEKIKSQQDKMDSKWGAAGLFGEATLNQKRPSGKTIKSAVDEVFKIQDFGKITKLVKEFEQAKRVFEITPAGSKGGMIKAARELMEALGGSGKALEGLDVASEEFLQTMRKVVSEQTGKFGLAEIVKSQITSLENEKKALIELSNAVKEYNESVANGATGSSKSILNSIGTGYGGSGGGGGEGIGSSGGGDITVTNNHNATITITGTNNRIVNQAKKDIQVTGSNNTIVIRENAFSGLNTKSLESAIQMIKAIDDAIEKHTQGEVVATIPNETATAIKTAKPLKVNAELAPMSKEAVASFVRATSQQIVNAELKARIPTKLIDVYKKDIKSVVSTATANASNEKVKIQAELVLGEKDAENINDVKGRIESLSGAFLNLPDDISNSVQKGIKELNQLKVVVEEIKNAVKGIADVKITLKHVNTKAKEAQAKAKKESSQDGIKAGSDLKGYDLSGIQKGFTIPEKGLAKIELNDLRKIYLQLMQIHGLAEKIPKAMFGSGENYMNFGKQRLVYEIDALMQKERVLEEQEKVERAVNKALEKQVALRESLRLKQYELLKSIREMKDAPFYADTDLTNRTEALINSFNVDDLFADGKLGIGSKLLKEAELAVKKIAAENKAGAEAANKAYEEFLEREKKQLALVEQRKSLEEKITSIKNTVGNGDNKFYKDFVSNLEKEFQGVNDNGILSNGVLSSERLDQIAGGYQKIEEMIRSATDAEMNREKAADESFKFEKRLIDQQNKLLKERETIEARIQKMRDEGKIKAEDLLAVEQKLAEHSIGSPYDAKGKASPLSGDVLNATAVAYNSINDELTEMAAKYKLLSKQEEEEYNRKKRQQTQLAFERDIRKQIADIRSVDGHNEDALREVEQRLDAINLEKLTAEGTILDKRTLDTVHMALNEIKGDVIDIDKATARPKSSIQDLAKKVRSLTGTEIWRNTSDTNILASYVGTEEQINRIRVARAEIEKLLNTINTFGREFTKDEAATFQKQYEDIVSEFQRAIEDVGKRTNKTGVFEEFGRDTLNVLDAVKEKILRNNDLLAKASDVQWTTKTTGDITRFTGVLTEHDGTVKTLVYDYNDMKGGLEKISVTEKKAESLMTRLTKLLRQRSDALIAYLGTFASFYRVVGELRKGVEIIKLLDTNMTELRRVSGATRGELEAFKATVFDTGREIGSAGDNIIKLAAEYARLGYSLSESSELAKASAMYMNVGFIDDANFAMQSLTSTMKAYGMTASSVMSIVDKFNEVGKLLPLNGYIGQRVGTPETEQRLNVLPQCA